MSQRNQILRLFDRVPITDFDHTPIDLSEQKGHLDKPKSGEQGLVVMAAGHVAKPKRRSPEGAYAMTIILREHWTIKLIDCTQICPHGRRMRVKSTAV